MPPRRSYPALFPPKEGRVGPPGAPNASPVARDALHAVGRRYPAVFLAPRITIRRYPRMFFAFRIAIRRYPTVFFQPRIAIRRYPKVFFAVGNGFRRGPEAVSCISRSICTNRQRASS